MKLIFSLLLISATTFGFASSAPGTCDDELNLYQEVVGLVNDQDATAKMDIREMAEITFVINEDNSIHVVQVLTKDYLFEFHIRQKLEGVKVNHCFEKDHAYTILVNAKLV